MARYTYVQINHTHIQNWSAPSCYLTTAVLNDFYSEVTAYTALAYSYWASYSRCVWMLRSSHKLYYLAINGSLLSWIKCFLTDRQQQVIVNGEISSLLSVTSGVPQGTVLAPLLFLCYINDVTKDISSNIKLYADDVLIYNIINSEEDCVKLQKDLEWMGCDLENVFQHNKM